MTRRVWALIAVAVGGSILSGCAPTTSAITRGASSAASCTSPIASKAWYMQPSEQAYFDANHSFSFETYPQKVNGNTLIPAFFEGPEGTYSFVPVIDQTAPGVFKLSFNGTGHFTGKNAGRDLTIDFSGTVDETTSAADLTLKAEGQTIRVVDPANDLSEAIALSKRVASDLESKNWSDVFDAYSKVALQGGSSAAKADVAKRLQSDFGHVTTACRLGPGQYTPAPAGFSALGDRYIDVLAVTVAQKSGGTVATFVVVVLMRWEGTWQVTELLAPGTDPHASGPKDFGIPVPSA